MPPTHAPTDCFPGTAATEARRPRLLGRIAYLLWRWTHRAESRRWIAEMSDHQLRDIGLTRLDAAAEARKPFWMP